MDFGSNEGKKKRKETLADYLTAEYTQTSIFIISKRATMDNGALFRVIISLIKTDHSGWN